MQQNAQNMLCYPAWGAGGGAGGLVTPGADAVLAAAKALNDAVQRATSAGWSITLRLDEVQIGPAAVRVSLSREA